MSETLIMHDLQIIPTYIQNLELQTMLGPGWLH